MEKDNDARKIAKSLTSNQRMVLQYIMGDLFALASEYPKATFTSLRKKGLIDRQNKITDKGVFVFGEL